MSLGPRVDGLPAAALLAADLPVALMRKARGGWEQRGGLGAKAGFESRPPACPPAATSPAGWAASKLRLRLVRMKTGSTRSC